MQSRGAISLLGAFFSFLIACSSELQCKDANNQPVDWFVIYKLPKNKNSNGPINDGLGYMYLTSENYKSWTLSTISINDSDSIVGYTLKPMYDAKKNTMYVLYNDESPSGSTTSSKGHTKGVVMADKNSGFWLIHSVPRFPYSLDKYEYPESGAHCGQSFVCISLNLTDLNKVGIQLQYNEASVFAQNVLPDLEDILPDLVKAANNATIDVSPWYSVQEIFSKAGLKFISFAKSRHFEKDLYLDLVAPSLENDLWVETWPNEPNRLPSSCDSKFQVYNVIEVTSNVADLGLIFNSTVDHSKWAVSVNNSKNNWTCIGDINRAEKQTKRGGGTMCINNKQVATNYQQLVDSVQKCQ